MVTKCVPHNSQLVNTSQNMCFIQSSVNNASLKTVIQNENFSSSSASPSSSVITHIQPNDNLTLPRQVFFFQSQIQSTVNNTSPQPSSSSYFSSIRLSPEEGSSPSHPLMSKRRLVIDNLNLLPVTNAVPASPVSRQQSACATSVQDEIADQPIR